MSRQGLNAKHRVAKDLLARGATEVKITDDTLELKITSVKEKSNGEQLAQNININVSASAQAQASASQKINEIIHSLDRYKLDATKLADAEKHLKQLEDELKKPSPAWDITKKSLGWILNTSKDLFLRVAPVIIEHCMSTPPPPSS